MVKVQENATVFGGDRDSKKIAASIHMDLDGVAHVYRVHGWSIDAPSDCLFESGLRRALDFFDAARVRATLFVIAEDLEDPRKRELIKEAFKRGHEIASHSRTHRKLSTLEHDEKRREIFESRERIAATLGVDVCGFRAPEFDVDHESLELIDAAGYTYDSSLFYDTKSRKVRDAKLGAHQPLEHLRLVELPLPTYAPLPVPFHPCYSLVLGTWYFRLGLARFQRTSAPLVLLLHLTDFADPLPAEQLNGWKSRVFTLSYMSADHKQKRCNEMLELVQRDYELIDTTSLVAMYSQSSDGCIAKGTCL